MLPAGYMAKQVSTRPDWINNSAVTDIYSVSSCISNAFTDYFSFGRFNGYWLFDRPDVIHELAQQASTDLFGMKMFYYEIYDQEFDEEANKWLTFHPDPSLPTKVTMPPAKSLNGFDIVSFSSGTCAECSPLSCNNMAASIHVNSHCLLPSLEKAKELLERHAFANTEPGPFRIFAVYSI
jgi:hypothetical protein